MSDSDGEERSQGGGTLNRAEGLACWEPWEDPVRSPWRLLMWEY